MGLRSPFFRQLFIPYAILLGAAIGALGFYAARLVRHSYLEDREQALREEARLVDALVAADVRGGRAEGLSARLKAYGESAGCRITLVAEDGLVLADSEADPTRMDNHRLRPEIVAAAGQGEGMQIRPSATLGIDMMYYAVRRGAAGGAPPYYVRLAVPLRKLQESLGSLYTMLAVAGGLAVLLGGLICYGFARRQARAVIELTRMAEALEHGDLRRRVHPEATGELAAIARSLNAAAESLARAESLAARSLDERLTILAGMNEGVLATDAKLRIRYGNPAAAALLDYDPAGIQDQALWEVVRDDRILKAAREVLETGERKTFQAGPVRDRHLAVSLSPLPSRGRPEGLVLVVHDISQSVRYEELRKEFVANVSHELRTPLTAIRGFVETLQEGALHDPDKGPAFLATIAKHARQLTNLVEDLLEISRLEGRSTLPRRTRVDVGRTIRNVADLLGPAAQRKGQSLAVEAPEDLPPVAGDPDYLERAVANLVDNAVKYTPDGGSIRIAAERRGEQVVIEVSDTGIGIPAADLPRIFERFYRVDKSRSREMGGTGLGLSIVKHIVQAHGGTVEASSEPGKGSVFRITLPPLA